jgi:hypothetical protein
MDRETELSVIGLIIVALICIFVAFLYSLDYHHDKTACFANGGVWSEQMSTGDSGFSWKCTYNPHTEVTIK